MVAAGHAVRGTTRNPARADAIAAAGAEPYIGDPDRIGTLMDALHAVTILVWLFGELPDEDLHGGRLRMLFEKLVDTPVRGFLYEAAGSVPASVLESGTASVRRAGETWRIPVSILEADTGDPSSWEESALAATSRLAAGAGEPI